MVDRMNYEDLAALALSRGEALAKAEAEIARLREALKTIAAATPEPDEKDWFDDYGDYAGYRSFGVGGALFECSVDSSNSGDVHNHGFEMGLHSAAKIARAALGGDDA